jgi:hypothetical protein
MNCGSRSFQVLRQSTAIRSQFPGRDLSITMQRDEGRRECRKIAMGLFEAACIFLLLCGCGKKDVTPLAVAKEGAAESKPRESSLSTTARSNDGTAKPTVRGTVTAPKDAARTKKGKRKSGSHIGAIHNGPLSDVFFDQPLAVLQENAPAAAEGAKKRLSDDSAADETRGAEVELLPPPPGTEADWSTFLTGEVLANESLAIRTSLNGKLQSVGKYNGSYKQLRVDAATLAVLAGIAGTHPEAPGWKAHARYVRDLSGEIVRSASANGEKFYKPAKAAFDKLDELLSGNKPPHLDEAAEKVSFSEVVSRVPLMYRMERAYNDLKLNVNTETLLKKESARVVHEGGVLAALAKVIAEPGYDDADLDDYRKFAAELQYCGTEAAAAATNGDFQAYTTALDRGHKACTQCHEQFKND